MLRRSAPKIHRLYFRCYPEDALDQSRISVAIMAGGKSSRMGRDKSFVPLLGKPMIEHVIERVQTLADNLIINTKNPRF